MPCRLTYGVEFEFTLAVLSHGDDRDPDPDSAPSQQIVTLAEPDPESMVGYLATLHAGAREARERIAVRLREAGLPTHSDFVPPGMAVPEWDDTGNRVYNNEWDVGTDGSVRGPNGKYEWVVVEVASPPYIYGPESLEAVRLACRTITSHFRVNVNQSCGLHVHVGNGSVAFAVETIRKLMMFLWVFEPQLDQLQAPHRLNAFYCGAMHQSSEMAVDHMQKRAASPTPELFDFPAPNVWYPMSVVAGLELLSQTRDVEGLHELLRDRSGKPAYSIVNLCGHSVDGMKRTIEFRQHAGSLDGDVVTAWITTVVQLVEFIQTCDTKALLAFLLAHARAEDASAPRYDIVDLLRDLGLEEPAAFWSAHLPNRPRPALHRAAPRTPPSSPADSVYPIGTPDLYGASPPRSNPGWDPSAAAGQADRAAYLDPERDLPEGPSSPPHEQSRSFTSMGGLDPWSPSMSGAWGSRGRPRTRRGGSFLLGDDDD